MAKSTNPAKSNTKLNKSEKESLNAMLYAMGANGFAHRLEHNGETVVAYTERGNTTEFSISVASPDEKKFRPRVGAYYALDRFNAGQTVKMEKYDFEKMLRSMAMSEYNLKVK